MLAQVQLTVTLIFSFHISSFLLLLGITTAQSVAISDDFFAIEF